MLPNQSHITDGLPKQTQKKDNFLPLSIEDQLKEFQILNISAAAVAIKINPREFAFMCYKSAV